VLVGEEAWGGGGRIARSGGAGLVGRRGVCQVGSPSGAPG
jgi:hypothetical protein